MGMELVFINLMSFFGGVLLYGVGLGLPIIIIGTIVGYNLLYKYRVIIHQPQGKILFAKALITKKGLLKIKKPKYKMQSFDLDLCSVDPKGKYIFHLFQENANTFRQLKAVAVDSKGTALLHQAEDKSIDFLVETWKKNQKEVFTLEGLEKYKDLIMLGFIIVFNIVSMALIFKAAGFNV
jgi:hypothetical protein